MLIPMMDSVQRTMLRLTEKLLGCEELFFFSFREDGIHEPIPQIIHRRIGGMDQIRCIPAIIPQFVQDNLIGRKISDAGGQSGNRRKTFDRKQ